MSNGTSRHGALLTREHPSRTLRNMPESPLWAVGSADPDRARQPHWVHFGGQSPESAGTWRDAGLAHPQLAQPHAKGGGRACHLKKQISPKVECHCIGYSLVGISHGSTTVQVDGGVQGSCLAAVPTHFHTASMHLTHQAQLLAGRPSRVAVLLSRHEPTRELHGPVAGTRPTPPQHAQDSAFHILAMLSRTLTRDCVTRRGGAKATKLPYSWKGQVQSFQTCCLHVANDQPLLNRGMVGWSS
jgi:hypothetical protein